MPTNKFHYIWMGSVVAKHEDAFKNGPNDLARQLRELISHRNTTDESSLKSNPQDQEIIMWVPEDIIDDIRERNLLDPLITLKPIEDIYKNSKHLGRKELDKLRRSVDVLGENKAYSAQKDVLSAAILEEHGGYYFDTTTQIESISSLIETQPQEIWFPTIMVHNESSDYVYHGELVYNTSYLKKGKEETFSDLVYLPDVWALHCSKPGNGIFRKMLNSYTQKCQYFFPESFENPHISKSSYTMRSDGFTFHKSGYTLGEEGSGAQIMQNENRDRLIGELVIFSLLDAVSESYGAPTEDVMEKLSSPAIEINHHKYVESMGIKKFHNGLWRKDAVATRMDHSISAPPVIQNVAKNETQATKEKSRTHLMAVNSSAFKDIKLKYQEMKGDKLKREIIADFRKQIAEIDSLDALDLFVKDFKQSVSYNVLKTGQGLFTRTGARETGSVKTINDIVSAKTLELEQAKSHNSRVC